MKAVSKKIGKEQFITDSNGAVEYVIIPILEYEKIIELLEDYGLGLAMQEAEKDKIFTKEKALEYLQND